MRSTLRNFEAYPFAEATLSLIPDSDAMVHMVDRPATITRLFGEEGIPTPHKAAAGTEAAARPEASARVPDPARRSWTQHPVLPPREGDGRGVVEGRRDATVPRLTVDRALERCDIEVLLNDERKVQ